MVYTVISCRILSLIHISGIRTQLYSEQKKFKHKIGYADKLGIPFVIFLGEDEINAGVVAVKDMESGEQVKVSLDEMCIRDSKVVVGDTVETSGRGGVFPKGILIGTVESVQPEESGLSYYAVIKPFVSCLLYTSRCV